MVITMQANHYLTDGVMRAYEVVDGVSLMDFLTSLSLDMEDIGVVSVNNKRETSEYVLRDSDVIILIPPFIGG